MVRQLVATVFVDGVPFVAGTDVPPDIAALITNPAAWAVEPETEPTKDPAAGGTRGDELAELRKLSKDDLFALAEARGVDVARSASKEDLIAAITAASG